MKKTTFILLLLILSYSFLSCKSSADKIGGLIDDIKPHKEELEKKTTEEISKLSTFEYKVAEFKSNITNEELQTKLEELGQERWDCFHVERQTFTLTFFCKRRPKTYLRYIPKLF